MSVLLTSRDYNIFCIPLKTNLFLVRHRPVPWVQHQASGVGDIFTDQYSAMGAIQFRHFNSLQDVVSPVQVPTHPVHSKALCYSHSTVKYLSKRESFSVK